MRDIKTKQKMQAIKTKDTKGNIRHFIKQQTIHNKNVDRKEEASVKSNPQVQATNNVSVAAKQTVVESKHRATKFIKQKRNEYKIKSTSKKSIIESSHDIQPQRISYISKAKKHVVNKVNVSKIKQTTEQIISKPIVQNATQAIKKSFHIVKKSVSTLNTLFSFGTGLILLIVITLFIGTFSVLAQDGGSNSEIVSLSEEVLAYTSVIQQYASQYGIPEYVSAIQAIMMQESGGRGTDPMQCSESPYNTRFPHTPGSITDPDYSIEVGVQTFADCIRQAGCSSPQDLDKLKLAWQGYNYGNGYIGWALQRGGYTEANALQFSQEQAASHGWSSYGDPQYVPHVMRYYSGGSLFAGLFGNQQIVSVAMGQLGNSGGQKFWSWYGFDSRVEWCACFVSWCADQSGLIASGNVPKFSLCSDGVSWFQGKNKWQSGGTTPTAGMIIFFDWDHDGTSDHVGIVEKCEGGRVYTIEGNSSDQVRQRNYAVDYSSIMGYGVIN